MTFDVEEVEADPIIKQWTYGGMGVGSQGDGSIQFPAPDKDGIVKPVVLISIPLADVSHYGILTGTWEDKDETELNISQMTEKPKASYAEEYLGVKCKDGDKKYMSVFGQYILTPEVFEQLRQDINESTDPYKEIELTSALEKVRQREGMIGVQLQGRMFDMGNFNAYRNCAKDFTNM